MFNLIKTKIMDSTKNDNRLTKTELYARNALKNAGILRRTADSTTLDIKRLLAADDRQLSMMRSVGRATLSRIAELRQAVKWLDKA